ncbi:selenide, water dikinase SelD [Microcoleus sp. FACHB-1515]|uniref:selenide, water dikinase SelD n=1 Tax=Cyanophyceae TaxID=3028117 RepID=UPI001685BD25|nr:selenide, water dikinase SelD [Microcoleus sp. FACHB-1515]MBD2091463.1 selenide, water dikinase SelD [Microcoleus sp. FACHB-1515]
MQVAPIAQDLVLVGGGHSHAIALKQFGMKPIPGVRITLITDVVQTPYSGMLPGYVAGLYDFDECHIDLRPLSNFAQAQIVVDRAVGLDLVNQRVICANRPPIAFDVLSIGIGSTPTVAPVPGADKYAIAVKPIAKFLDQWQKILDRVRENPQEPLTLAIVGGGAGGVELTLAVQANLQRIYQQCGQPPANLQVHLVHRGDRLLPSRSATFARKVEKLLRDRNVHLHLNESVIEVERDRIRCESGLEIECAFVFWVTQASAATWLRESGLATDEDGFVLVDDCLRSSHPQIFAAGDVATMQNHPRPKAGVFAVRQGQPLAQNLRRALQGELLRPFQPQKNYLILLGTGTGAAIASRDPFCFGAAGWIWNWKDRIDRQFMQKFRDLEPMGSEGSGQTSQSGSRWEAEQPAVMQCAGCGSKVGSGTLESVLQRLKQSEWSQREEVLIGLDAPDDAAVVRVPSDRVLVQTIDYFRDLVNDPYLFGQIATNHCLSDLFAMGASPQSALAIATLPRAIESKQEETLYALMAGAIDVLNQANAVLVGGHTIEGTELAFGLTCNGFALPDRLLRKSGMQIGDALILTKAIGTGTLFAADMRLQAKGRWIEGAIASMLQSNQAAASVLQAHHANACTDVTGFGLLGHLAEMVQASNVSVSLQLEAIALLDGAVTTATQGILSSLHPQNSRVDRLVHTALRQHPHYPLLFDPQTAGGLLASVPQAEAIACLETLIAKGYTHSRIIGQVLPPSKQAAITIES